MKKTNFLTIGLTLLLIFCFLQCSSSRKIKVACIGDSISAGDWLEDPLKESYPSVLREMLGGSYQLMNFSRGGATLMKNGNYPYWNLSEFGNAVAYEPDLVVIKLGTNDAKPYNIPAHPGEFERDMNALIDTFISLPSKPHIFLCLPVPSFRINFDINDTITTQEVLPVLKKIASERTGITLIDLYSLFREKSELFPDGVHPDKEGARQIASIIQQSILDQKSQRQRP